MESSIANSSAVDLYSRARFSRIPSSISVLHSVCQEAQTSIQGPYEITALEQVLTALESSGLPGPAILIGSKKYLGSGAQFIVHQQSMVRSQMDSFSDTVVAVKQPKFNLDPNTALSLTDKDAQQHLKNIVLEVEVLTRSSLIRHPNIVRLLYWAYDFYSTHLPISLVMELAMCDLKQLLIDKAEMPQLHKYGLCADVAAALDAIHECELVHGDLKPENILIFREQGRLVAKLADFGLSVKGFAGTQKRTKLGGTPGWQAPEVEKGQALLPQELMRADNYSFGLLCWSATLGSGLPPPQVLGVARTAPLLQTLEEVRGVLDHRVLNILERAAHHLLLDEHDRRPQVLLGLFEAVHDDRTVNPHIVYEPAQSSFGFEHDANDVDKDLDPMPTFVWEVPSLPTYFIRDICARFMSSPGEYPSQISSALFFHLTFKRLLSMPEVSPLGVLLRASLHGCKALYEVFPSASDFYGAETPEDSKLQSLSWLEEAVSMGSVLGKHLLHTKNPAIFNDSLQRFRDKGGYLDYYFADRGSTQLHALASYGSLEQIRHALRSATPGDIEARTPNRETPLYLACARGSWGIAAQLLNAGANAAVLCTEFQISCLHWIFAFEWSTQSIAARRLVENGADPNAVLGQAVPFPHYPFLLPAGTPLHWAVVTASHSAIDALLEQGANVQVRDGSDPYRYDNRFRYLDKFGGPNQESFSIAEKSTQGLSSLDYSVMEFDSYLLEHLLHSGAQVDVNATDEEGVCVLHRLSANHIRHTRAFNAYSFLPFRGSQASQTEQQRRIVSAVVSLGGDLDKLTTPGTMYNQRGRQAALDSYTPLMLAVMGDCTSLVDVLLEAGASADFVNPEGNPVLLCLPDTGGTACGVIGSLISAGANIHARGHTGNTVLIKAAAYRDVSAVDFLLSHGADIEDTDVNHKSFNLSWNVFELLARDEDPFEESHDVRVAQLLERHVFRHSDAAKSHRVVHYCSRHGETLLYRFAHHAMQHCVISMLANGANPNALANKSSLRWDKNKTRYTLSWEETPLDAVQEFKKRREERMTRDRAYSLPEFENLRDRVNAVVEALELAGGTYANSGSKETYADPGV